MQISSIDQTYLTSILSKLNNQAAATSEEIQADEAAALDSASISPAAMSMSKMPPPPEEMDFENMSDDDLKDYLQQMYNITGTIPGIDDGTSLDELSEEQLSQVRGTLIEMASRPRPEAPPPMPSSESVSSMDDDELKSLLSMLLEKTGSILGADYDSEDVESMTSDQLQAVREAIMQSMAQRYNEQKVADAYGQSTMDA